MVLFRKKKIRADADELVLNLIKKLDELEFKEGDSVQKFKETLDVIKKGTAFLIKKFNAVLYEINVKRDYLRDYEHSNKDKVHMLTEIAKIIKRAEVPAKEAYLIADELLELMDLKHTSLKEISSKTTRLRKYVKMALKYYFSIKKVLQNFSVDT